MTGWLIFLGIVWGLLAWRHARLKRQGMLPDAVSLASEDGPRWSMFRERGF